MVYLLHFAKPISPNHTCQHYLGFSDTGFDRILQQRVGGSQAARLCQVAKERGIDFVVARIWPDGDRRLERQLKNRKDAPRLCPICQQTPNAHQLPLFPGLVNEVNFYHK